ncbi:relaxase/mobilization nuclease [Chitinophaga parva]|uniref:Relaxase/mobilization nuclease n=1 Tax=Chitinophaga parva TaxID=2169414 RepID=A0A2T7BLR8_9BACT|nr:relaxase/mobilization nuclease domain-containing protein [Chitinophaga parva]PUZ28612.1 relaxase/mobilization nuclease [Chitinophaga parva]
MVAKVKPGKTIRGILNYNENKVKAGKASCIGAEGFGCRPDELDFKSKLFRFTDLQDRNRIAQTNAVHISLAFHPSEKLSDQQMVDIARSYMQRIGFGDQPYLIYRHNDTHHPHLHVATTNIKSDGDRISLHYIGRDVSEPARMAVEQEFGLVAASAQEKKSAYLLSAIDIPKVTYSKAETKASISNVVRSSIWHYKFSSLEGLDAILHQFNVAAYRGKPGSIAHEQGGLSYQLIDDTGQRVGNAIKASTIYEKPTLKKLQELFVKKAPTRDKFKGRLIRVVDHALRKGRDLAELKNLLATDGVFVHIGVDQTTGGPSCTFVDNKTFCAFEGTELGLAYSAASVFASIATGPADEIAFNQHFVQNILANTDYTGGLPKVMARWAKQGLMVSAVQRPDGSRVYRLGHISTEPQSYTPADGKLNAYFKANSLSPELTSRLIRVLQGLPFYSAFLGRMEAAATDFTIPLTLQTQIDHVVEAMFEGGPSGSYLPRELLAEARKKKKKKSS